MTLAMTRTVPSATKLAGFPGHATAVSYRVQENLDYGTYEKLLDNLLAMRQGSGWWLGDLLNQFEADFGERYTAALPDRQENEALYQYCADAKWLAGKFSISDRSEKLSLTHHRIVVSLERDERTLWLDRAVKNRWSVRGLRTALKAAQKADLDQDAPELVSWGEDRLYAASIASGTETIGTPAPGRPVNPDAEQMVNEFLGAAPSEEPAAPSEAPRLPIGTMVIPADADLLARALAAFSVRPTMIGRGVIAPPVQAAGRWWCPVGYHEDHQIGRMEVTAVRVMLLERYMEGDYTVHNPLVTAEAWEEEIQSGTREATDYAGLRVVTDPSSAEFVLLRERATFCGKSARPEATTSPIDTQTPRAKESGEQDVESMAAPVPKATAIVHQPVAQTEAKPNALAPCFCCEISEGQRAKLATLVDLWKTRWADTSVTAATLLNYLIDAAYESEAAERMITKSADDGG